MCVWVWVCVFCVHHVLQDFFLGPDVVSVLVWDTHTHRDTHMQTHTRKHTQVVVRAWKDGGAVSTSLTASCDGFEVQWGVALQQMDSWSHPKTAEGGKYAALVPPGSRDHLGTAVRTPLFAGAPLVFNAQSCGQRGDELWGVRFIIVEATSGKLYPPGGMTLFSPLKEGVDMSYVIKPDYGSLEERLAKRQNLPIELEGDHGRDQITVGNDNDGGADRNYVEALHVQPAHIDTDVGSLLHQAANRILPWVNGDKGTRFSKCLAMLTLPSKETRELTFENYACCLNVGPVPSMRTQATLWAASPVGHPREEPPRRRRPPRWFPTGVRFFVTLAWRQRAKTAKCSEKCSAKCCYKCSAKCSAESSPYRDFVLSIY